MMDEFINNLAYEVFSIFLVVFLVLGLFLLVKRKYRTGDEDQRLDN